MPGGGDTSVLSIGRLAPGAAEYYLNAVAGGVEDYYSEGDAPGRWMAAGTSRLGLDGAVDGNDLRSILDGCEPATGERLGRAANRSRPGFDLTFRGPKSVSVLFGIGDDSTRAQVVAAHEEAVDAAVGWLEAQAARSRRGHNGVTTVGVDGFVAAGFRHRSSRAGDPHLHTHVLVANLARGDDGRWATLDGRLLYANARTAGFLYEAHLRHAMTRRLGVDWRPATNGIADVDGIPTPVLRAFSKRRVEIEAHLAERGQSSARAADVAALATRRAKAYDVDVNRLRAGWRAEAREAGLTPAKVNRLLDRTTVVAVDEDIVGVHLSSPSGLTHHESTFDRSGVLRAVAEHARLGATVDEVVQVTDAYLRRAEVVGVAAELWSTAELIEIERRLVVDAASRRDSNTGVADEAALREALKARPTMSDEQIGLVAGLTTRGNGVEVIVAAAGTGKTFSLDAARDAWQRSGFHVTGAALAARTAAELQAGSGIESTTITRLVAGLERGEDQLTAKSVLVVDEAGMVGTRALASLMDRARASGAKIVLVGDPRQLPEIQAGGVLAGLAARQPSLTLNENRRQAQAWERAALADLRAGRVDEALAAYAGNDRIVTETTASDVRERMVSDWWAGQLAGEQAIMLASRWSDVDDLNARARARMVDSDQLGGPRITVDGRPYQVGDEVMTLRNDRRLGVRNGWMWKVVRSTDVRHARRYSPGQRACDSAQVVSRGRPPRPWLRHDRPQGPGHDGRSCVPPRERSALQRTRLRRHESRSHE